MESQEPRLAEPHLRPEEENDRYTRIRSLDPDKVTDESVDDDDFDDE